MQLRFLLAAIAVTVFASLASAQPRTPCPDGAVHAVHFCDTAEGWAVGDEGVIWHSIDGGVNWERQQSGTRACLQGVHFSTPYSGWAVGRVETTSGTSVGMMLKTSDGGLKWEQVGTNALPGLHFVRFFDEKRGIVGGDGSDGMPSGLFVTSDAGKTWLPLRSTRCPSWRAADFYSPSLGIVAGSWSKLGRFDRTEYQDAELDPLSGRTVHAVAVTRESNSVGLAPCFAVGDGGMVLRSSDAGKKWGFVDLGLAPAALAACDFRCVAAVGANVWVAGRPGGFILHSSDSGKSWAVQKTGLTTPVNGMQFLNESVGWVVGDMGVILGTTDGGKSWRVQKVAGQQAAVLFMHASGKHIPLDTIAALGSDGYLCAAVGMTSADPATADPRWAGDDMRLRSAMRQAGGAAGETVWSFPASAHAVGLSPMDLMAFWDAKQGGKAAEQLLRQAVLAIRIWQPEVIVTDIVATDAEGADVLVLHAAREAFKQAADPAAFSEQITQLGLKPWAAKKLYALSPDSPSAPVRLDHNAFDRRLGDSPKDSAESATRLVSTDPLPDGRRFYKLVAHRMPGAESHAGLMDGIVLAYGGPSRRPEVLTTIDAATQRDREAAARERHQLEGFAKVNDLEFAGPDKVLAVLGDKLKQMPDDTAARTAFTVAGQLVRSGKWAEAREVYGLVVDRYPGHPLAIDAFRWMTRYHASSEARRRVEIQQRMSVKSIAFEAMPGASGRVIPAHGTGGPVATPTVQEDAYRLFSPDMIYQWHQSCLELEPMLRVFGPVYAYDPAAWLCFFTARRQVGRHTDADAAVAGYFKSLPGLPPGSDAWRDCLAAELWLTNPSEFPAPPKPVGYCRFTETRPILDGKLNEQCWANLKPLTLKVTTAATEKPDDVKAFADNYKTEARFAYDDKFLYIAVTCDHPAGKQVPPVAKRERDTNLRGHDRVDIILDMDRDYQTYYRFQIDHRGCLAEDCWGDGTWNPKYSVAFHPTETGWTTELAIPLQELTGDRPAHGRTWAANVSRVVPGQGVMAWSGPADQEPRPEGMGLLQFRAER